MFRKFSIEIECSECSETSAEYIQDNEHPYGAIVIKSKHHGRKHRTVIDVRDIPHPMLGQFSGPQKDPSSSR